MGIWVNILVAGLIIWVVMYLLYRSGIAVIEVIAAAVIVFRRGKSGDKVSMVSCNGWIRHVGRFRESRIYQFSLDSQLSKGEVGVLLLDRKKREILRLNSGSPSGRAELQRESRYYLRWEFRNATGKCELFWE